MQEIVTAMNYRAYLYNLKCAASEILTNIFIVLFKTSFVVLVIYYAWLLDRYMDYGLIVGSLDILMS